MDSIVRLCFLALAVSIGAAYFLPDYLEKTVTAQSDGASAPTFEARRAPVRQPITQAYQEDDGYSERAVRLRAGRNGHFYMNAKVNGTSLPFVVDSGASFVSLDYDAAQRAGIRLTKSDFKYVTNTANGRVLSAKVTIKNFRYKSIRMRNVRASVRQPGAVAGVNLLGNSFLSRLKEYRVRNGTLVMVP
ncbi:MAG: TIGR02281 family clan AA aspartic protease [Pseudomonadota bacterium]